LKPLLLTLIFIISVFVDAFGQQFSLHGTVSDAINGETLIGVNIRVDQQALGVSTNSYGYYVLSLAKGEYRIKISAVGYQTQTKVIKLGQNTKLDIQMERQKQLDSVEIQAFSMDDHIKNPQMGLNRLDVKTFRDIPVLFGERDVLKTMQLLPGVLSVGEGNSGFLVRGGTTDQNLILLDEAMVYNASHLLGFFSIFNSDAIKEVNLYKGEIPAQYGGRLASVLDVQLLEGNREQFGVEGGIGLIASRIKVDGPIKKGRGSFMLSGRRTYADLFLKLLPESDANKSKLYFYDLNLKANYQFNANNRLYISGYLGKDALGYADDFRFDWGNTTGTVRWNHLFGPKFFSNTALIYSDFNYHIGVFTENNDIRIASKIQQMNLKQDFSYFNSRQHIFRFGIQILRQQVAPTAIEASDASDINTVSIEKRQGIELATYFSDDWHTSSRLRFIYGLRLHAFALLGPGTFREYDEQGEITALRNYDQGTFVKTYFNLEPRFSANLMLNEQSSLKASYNRNTQILHQLSNSTASLPTDVWMLSSPNIEPQIADQGALGYYRNIKQGQYEFSAEVYYKSMQNQIDYRNGADLLVNENIEAELVYGQGRAYGLELYFRKKYGVFKGWISYTLSRSRRQFDAINEGRWFASRQDRLHDLALVGFLKLSPTWSFSGTFVYNTGSAVTFPSGKYQIGERSVWYYTERNGYRMPDYHRLDIGATWTSKVKRRFQSSWTFGLYNVYNRKNAYIIDFRENKDNPNITEAYQIALFGIVPSVTWNFKF